MYPRYRQILMEVWQAFNNMDEFSYRTDALDVLKGSSLMQYIPDKRMLQDVLQTYFELGRNRGMSVITMQRKQMLL